MTIKGGSEQAPIRVILDSVTIDQSSVKPSRSPVTVESGDDESGSISIRGNGTVNAQAGWESAAIGAGDQGHSGPININGNSSRLAINAYSPKPQNPGESFVSYAAIIGAGDGSASDIAINNANVNLNGPGIGTIDGAGIGSGSSNDLSVKDKGIGNITIRNAKIRFYGIHQMHGAGIGGGKLCSCANISIDGATVVAAGGEAAAGIGSSGISDSTVLSGVIETTWNTICGNISISGASNVTATGGAGARKSLSCFAPAGDTQMPPLRSLPSVFFRALMRTA